MAFNAAPSGYFPDIDVGAVITGVTGVFIPWSNLENFNTSTSGDIRQLIYSFDEAVADAYLSLATNDKPTQMVITRSQSMPSATGIRKVYNHTINLAFSGDLTVVYESGV